MAVVSQVDRRTTPRQRESVLKLDINDEQLVTLRMLERFGWCLRFVRHRLFQEPLAAVYDPDHKTLAIIKPNGDLIENPPVDFRH